MADNKHKIGWIGMGRMGYPMAERLLKAGNDVSIWNRTKSKAEPLSEIGGKIVDAPSELADCDIVFTMVATGKDLGQVLFGDQGVLKGVNGQGPKIYVDCSSISEGESEEYRTRLDEAKAQFLAAPVSGNGKCVKAGKLSQVVSGPEGAFEEVRPYLETISGAGVAYVGDGELARFCKIAHNVLLGVYIQNLIEITVMANKAGVPRHAFLDFINKSVMGSVFSKYKSNALVNLDWTTTFTPTLLRKDMDLGITAGHALNVPMPVTIAAREAIQAHFGAATLQDDPEEYINKDFSALLETHAMHSGMDKLEPEGVNMPTGLEVKS